jgi:hypothetical protein
VLIGTDRFHSVLVACRDLGGLDARWAEIPHPVQSLDRAGLRQRAEESVPQILAILLGH